MTCWLCGYESPAQMCKNEPCQFCVEVAKVNEELRHLHAKRCNLLSEQNRAHDLMHRLPLELKSHIFELVLSLSVIQDEWGRIIAVRGRMPLYLASICRGWRDIAWSTPSLWSTIRIMLGRRSTSGWADFVHNRILRSRTLPLTFLIEVPVNDNKGSEGKSEDLEDDFKEQLYDILKVMSQCSYEWQTLSLHIPFSYLHIFYDDSVFQSHLLTVKRLSISCGASMNRPVSPSNPKMNPEKIEIYGLSFQSLQISWNHLTSAKINGWDLEGIAQLFQHASQMTHCHISQLRRGAPNFAMPPIIHQRLQSLQCDKYRRDDDLVTILLSSLTLPCLRTIRTDLTPAANIPALVHRSSCPLSRIAFDGSNWSEFSLRPLPGVTHLVLEQVGHKMVYGMLMKIFLRDYFPDLRQLTLGPEDFHVLLDVLLVLADVRNKVTLRKIFVRGATKSHSMWDSDFEQKLKVLQSSISWWEDGFEMILPGVVSSDEDMLPPVP